MGGSGLQQVFKLVMLRLVKLQRRLLTNCALLRYTTSTDSPRFCQFCNRVVHGLS